MVMLPKAEEPFGSEIDDVLRIEEVMTDKEAI
jgi:hypothetical protein